MTTIYDIAKASGVTATTVSNVLSGKGSVSVATRKRVLQAVKDLEYAPNLVARSLIKGRTGIIGLTVPSMDNPFYAETASAVERLAYAARLRVLITTIPWKDQMGAQLLKDLILRRVDGLLVTSNDYLLHTIRSVSRQQVPLVFCLYEQREDDHKVECEYVVSFDFLRAGQLAAEHLLSLGHQRVGLIPQIDVSGKPETGQARSKGFLTTMETHGHRVDPALIVAGDATLEGGRRAGAGLLAHSEPPSAIFATNDIMAMGVMQAAWERRLHVPDDLSVIGLDDISIAAYTSPPLTTIRIDKVALMAKAMELLLLAIEGKAIPSVPLFPATIIIRHSTAPYT
jgi:DNA-binding LacI/PurR family transcriptional regulator